MSGSTDERFHRAPIALPGAVAIRQRNPTRSTLAQPDAPMDRKSAKLARHASQLPGAPDNRLLVLVRCSSAESQLRATPPPTAAAACAGWISGGRLWTPTEAPTATEAPRAPRPPTRAIGQRSLGRVQRAASVSITRRLRTSGRRDCERATPPRWPPARSAGVFATEAAWLRLESHCAGQIWRGFRSHCIAPVRGRPDAQAGDRGCRGVPGAISEDAGVVQSDAEGEECARPSPGLR